jgi:arginyl-tRNA synthetase
MESLEIRNLKLEINAEEYSLLRSFVHYPEIISMSAKNYSPNLLCNYLYELSQKYNTFYNKHRILDNVNSGKWTMDSDDLDQNTEQKSPVTGFRLALTSATGQILRNGLSLLGIQAPEKM